MRKLLGFALCAAALVCLPAFAQVTAIPAASGGGGGTGCVPPSTSNVIAGDGMGGCVDSTIAPAAVATLSGAQSLTNKNINGVLLATFAFLDPTSSIQTQLNGKQATLTNPVTGTGAGSGMAKFTGANALGNAVADVDYDAVTGLCSVTATSGTITPDGLGTGCGTGGTKSIFAIGPLTAAATIAAPTNMIAGRAYEFQVTNGSTPYALTMPAAFQNVATMPPLANALIVYRAKWTGSAFVNPTATVNTAGYCATIADPGVNAASGSLFSWCDTGGSLKTRDNSGNYTSTVKSITVPAQMAQSGNGTLTPGFSFNAQPNYTQDYNSPYLQQYATRRTSTAMAYGLGVAYNGITWSVTGSITNNTPTAALPINVSIPVANGSSIGFAGNAYEFRTGRTHGMQASAIAALTVSLTNVRYIPLAVTDTTLAILSAADVPAHHNSAYIVYSATGTYTNLTDTTNFVLCTDDGTTMNCASTGVAANLLPHKFYLFEDITNSQWTGCVDGSTHCVNLSTHNPAAGTDVIPLAGAWGIAAVTGLLNWTMTQLTDDWF